MSLSRFHRTAILAALLICSTGVSLFAQKEPADYQDTVIEVLKGYQNLFIEKLDADVEDPAFNSWLVATEVINKGYMEFRVDVESGEFLHGVQFMVNQDTGETFVVMSSRVLDTYSDYPSLTYALLAGALRDAYNFFKDPRVWLYSRSDVMENLFLRFDSYAAEALLIRDRLIPFGYLVTPYESYILDSYEGDNLSGALMYLDGHSLPVVQKLALLRAQLEKTGDVESYREEILAMGEDLLKTRTDMPESTEELKIFQVAAGINTWLESTPVMISYIHNRERDDDPLVFTEVLNREPAYADLRRRMEASRTGDKLLIDHTVKETLQGLSAPK